MVSVAVQTRTVVDGGDGLVAGRTAVADSATGNGGSDAAIGVGRGIAEPARLAGEGVVACLVDVAMFGKKAPVEPLAVAVAEGEATVISDAEAEREVIVELVLEGAQAAEERVASAVAEGEVLVVMAEGPTVLKPLPEDALAAEELVSFDVARGEATVASDAMTERQTTVEPLPGGAQAAVERFSYAVAEEVTVTPDAVIEEPRVVTSAVAAGQTVDESAADLVCSLTIGRGQAVR